MTNTVFDFTLNDGTTVQMTLNFLNLYKLSNSDKKLYLDYNSKVTQGIKTELDNVLILYTAYRCANLENYMNYEEFLAKIPCSRQEIADILGKLLGIKKK